MKLNLLSCDAHRPDKRAIAKCFAEIATGVDDSLSLELADILLQGSAIEIEIDDKKSGSGLRALRKLSVDYEIVE